MNANKLRVPIDISMTLLSIILMGGTLFFTNERVHQILGIIMLVLWAIHVTLNRIWFSNLTKGKYQPYRIMQITVNIGVLVCAVVLMISGILLAWFVPITKAVFFAKMAHLSSSHWYFIFMAFHVGLHVNMMAARTKIHGILPQIASLLISLYGVYAFISRGIAKYLILRQKFFFFDYSKGHILFIVDYLAILVLFATISHYAAKLISKKDKN